MQEVVKAARVSSGPSGVPYKVFKCCSEQLLMAKQWNLLKGSGFPKEENSICIEQFSSISLPSVESKILRHLVPPPD